MKTFATFLESLGSELPYQIKRRDSERLVATVDDGDGAHWQIELDRMRALGTYNLHVMFSHSKYVCKRPKEGKSTATALKLYSTVGHLIVKYIKDFPVNVITFSPSEQKMIPTYDRLSKRIAKAVNGKAEVIGSGNATKFLITVG